MTKPAQPLQPPPKNGYRMKAMPPCSPADAKKIIEGRPTPVIWQPPASHPMALASNTAGGTTWSIAELARALKNNVDLIFQYVFNNVDYVPIYGAQKGALGTLIDGQGGPFDQCMLLVALLRQAGYTANYVLGQIQLTPSQLNAWLGVTDTYNWTSTNVLSGGGIPLTVNYDGSGNWTSTTLSHLWVQVNIGGTNYLFDPSYKTYTTKTGINIGTAMSYSQSTLLTDAQSGATVNANYVQNLNRGNVRSDVTTYANNLVSYLKTNMPAAGLDDIVGGRSIVQNINPIRQTSLSYEAPGDVPTYWTGDIPTTYKCTLEIKFEGIDQTFTSDQIYGQRLTITWNSSDVATLTLNGTVVATGNTDTPGYYYSLTQVVTHNAYSSPNANNTYYQWIYFGGTYALANGWSPTSRNMATYHQNMFNANTAAGLSNTSEPVMGEYLCMQFAEYWAEFSRHLDITGRIESAIAIIHHLIGVSGYDTTAPYFDLPGIFNWTNALYEATPDPGGIALNTFGFWGPGNEGGCIRRMLSVDDVDTYHIVDTAVANGQIIYNASSSNWTSTVKPNLTNWSSTVISDIETNWIDIGSTIYIPQNGAITIDQWTGNSMFGAFSSPGIYSYAVAGSFKGGGTGRPTPPPFFSPHPPTNPGPVPSPISKEPIDLFTGSYLYNRTDMTLGSATFPYALSFTRYYQSRYQYNNGPLGLGWTHNYNITATASSDLFLATGDGGGICAAAAIATYYVILDLVVSNPCPIVNALTCTAIERWYQEVITSGNTVVVSFPTVNETFVLLADGTYQSTYYNGSTLTLSSGAYTYKTKTGETFTFNTSGQLATWSSPNGMTVTLNYTSGQLTSISNGLGRTLTLSYTGNYITSVSDGNGRSISYNIDSNSDLTWFEDTLSNKITYSYTSPGLLSQIFLPNNPATAVVTNTFDTLNRVETQADANSNTWNYYFAGSRSEEDNPSSNARVCYFNKYGSVVRDIDQLGFETDTVYDGLNRVSSVTLPEGNSTEFTYDLNSNVLTVTSVPKSGSGLSNIVNTITYDSTWNKLHTLVDGNSNTWTCNWDATTGNLTNIHKPVVNSQTPEISFTYRTGTGQIATVTDETNIVTQFNYTVSTEKLSSIVVDYGTSPHLNLTTSFGYDSVGNVTNVTDPNSNQTSFQVDSERRMTQKTAPSPFSYVTDFNYDSNNRLTSVQRATGAMPAWQTYSYAYYVTGKLNTVTDPLNRVTTWQYDNLNRLQYLTDAQSRKTTFAYDAKSRISSITDSSNTVCDTRTYTNNGLLYQRTDARSKTTTYSYDGFDRPHRATYPDTTYEENTSYDNNGNVLTYTCRSGNSITNTFDALNRLSTKAPTSQATVTFTYDLANRITQIGTPTQTGNPAAGAFALAYDSAGRFYQETTPAVSPFSALVTSYQLDSNGNITKITYPDGYYVTRSFDQLNRLTNVYLNGSGTAALSFTYDQLSHRTQLSYGNSAVTSYTYELNNDMTSLLQLYNSTTSVNFTYGFNNTHQEDSRSVTDPTYVWHPSAGGTTSYGTANSVNQYPTVGSASYSYNGNGCLTSDGTWTYTFDTENHLTAASKTGTSASYVYDGMHRQIQKTVGSTETRFAYAGLQRIADYDGSSSNLQNRYVYGVGLDEPLITVNSSGTLTYMHADRLGSIIALTNSSGTVSSKYSYDPFGNSSSVPSTGFGYTSQRYDSETGLYFCKFRYFSTGIGRFLQPDPIGYVGGFNLYAYVANDPLNTTDTLGLTGTSGSNIFLPIFTYTYQYGYPPPSFLGIPAQGPPQDFQTASIDQNMVDALQYRMNWTDVYTEPVNVWVPNWTDSITWFISMVEPTAAWDYKAAAPGNPSAEYLGNYNFGAVAAVLGFSLRDAEIAAGIVQQLTNPSIGSGVPVFVYPYGDQLSDIPAIEAGYKYAITSGVVPATPAPIP